MKILWMVKKKKNEKNLITITGVVCFPTWILYAKLHQKEGESFERILFYKDWWFYEGIPFGPVCNYPSVT